MLIAAFIQWWYGPGWRDTATRLSLRIHHIYLNFSVPILFRTLFSPWRRIITSPGSSLQQKGRAALDNAVSRAVGFAVRLMAIIAALFAMAIYAVFGGLLLLTWPLLPLIGPALIVGGFIP